MLAAGRASTTRREVRGRGARRAEVADGFEGSCRPRRVLRSAIILSSVRISRSVSPSEMQSPPSGECYPRKHQTRAELSRSRDSKVNPHTLAQSFTVIERRRPWSLCQRSGRPVFLLFQPREISILLDYPPHPVASRPGWFDWIYVND